MLARALTLFACFVGASFLIGHAAHTEETPIRAPLSQLPMTLGSWRGVREPPFANRVLEVLGVDDYITRGYFRSAQSAVGLYIGYYRSQRQGETIHSPLNCLPGSGWEPVSRTTIRIPIDQDNRVNKVDSADVMHRASASSRSEPTAPIVVNRYVVQKDRLVLVSEPRARRGERVRQPVLPGCRRHPPEPHRRRDGAGHRANTFERRGRRSTGRA